MLTNSLTSSLTRSLISSLIKENPAFISTWKTDNTGTSNDDQISLPFESSGTYNFAISWGDGNSDLITVWDQAETTHTYAVAGTYTITISGVINGWRFNNAADEEKIIEISNWGTLLLGNNGRYFNGASNLIITATDILDTSAMTNFDLIFQNCSSLTTIPSINQWDVSNVLEMDGAFNGDSLLNPNIGNWNVSSTLDMQVMLLGTAFDRDISNWDVSNVASMLVMLLNTNFSRTNYDLLLVAWDQLTLQNNVNFHAGSAQYSAGAPATARANIISNFSWSITDGGQAP